MSRIWADSPAIQKYPGPSGHSIPRTIAASSLRARLGVVPARPVPRRSRGIGPSGHLGVDRHRAGRRRSPRSAPSPAARSGRRPAPPSRRRSGSSKEPLGRREPDASPDAVGLRPLGDQPLLVDHHVEGEQPVGQRAHGVVAGLELARARSAPATRRGRPSTRTRRAPRARAARRCSLSTRALAHDGVEWGPGGHPRKASRVDGPLRTSWRTTQRPSCRRASVATYIRRCGQPAGRLRQRRRRVADVAGAPRVVGQPQPAGAVEERRRAARPGQVGTGVEQPCPSACTVRSRPCRRRSRWRSFDVRSRWPSRTGRAGRGTGSSPGSRRPSPPTPAAGRAACSCGCRGRTPSPTPFIRRTTRRSGAAALTCRASRWRHGPGRSAGRSRPVARRSAGGWCGRRTARAGCAAGHARCSAAVARPRHGVRRARSGPAPMPRHRRRPGRARTPCPARVVFVCAQQRRRHRVVLAGLGRGRSTGRGIQVRRSVDVVIGRFSAATVVEAA